MSKASKVRQSFIDRGVSIRDWARTRGFSESLVYAILSGKTRGTRGESYRIAVALGLREPPSSSDWPAHVPEACQDRRSEALLP